MHDDRDHVRFAQAPTPDHTVLVRVTIAVLVCLLMSVGQTASVTGDLSSMCFAAAAVALFGVLSANRAAERRRRDRKALLHLRSARCMLDEVALVREHRRLLKEFGRHLCEPVLPSPEQSYGRKGEFGTGKQASLSSVATLRRKTSYAQESLAEW